MADFSDYIVYVDESGDHGLVSVDPQYPVFVLAFCVFKKSSYIKTITPDLQDFKFKYFGHDMVVLHEHEIRKPKGPFTILFDAEVRNEFLEDLNQIITTADFKIIATYIRKDEFHKKHGGEHNLYDVAVRSCLIRLKRFLIKQDDGARMAHVVFESRGKKEDKDLELEFRRVCSEETRDSHGFPLPFQIVMASKQINSCGLQLADLVARPIGRKLLIPDQSNRAFDVLEQKFFVGEDGEKEGLKCFP